MGPSVTCDKVWRQVYPCDECSGPVFLMMMARGAVFPCDEGEGAGVFL